MTNLYSRKALITGASSGIGEAFARKLASQDYDLILVARREKRLAQLARRLKDQYKGKVEILPADLSQPAGIEQVERRIRELPKLDLLVNNAGFSVPGKLAGVPLEKSLAMIDLHIIAVTRLSRATLAVMDNGGGIINVSSLAGLIPRGNDVVYCASKAYLIAFSQALQNELNGAGIKVQALCPGFVPTEFLNRPEYERLQVKDRIPKWLWTPAEAVVDESLRALRGDRVLCIPGLKNRAIVALARNKLTGMMLKKTTEKLGEPA